MVSSLILTGAVLVGSVLPVRMENVMTAPRFCEGIRSATPQFGMTYKNFHAEFALDTVAASKIEEQAILDAIDDGYSQSGAYIVGLRARAKAKADMALRHGVRTREGQIYLCGKISSNW